MNDQRYWFPAKRRGWGWGPPITVEGWVFLLTWCAIVIVASPILVQRGAIVVFGFLAMMIALLMVVCWMKGEPPRWRS